MDSNANGIGDFTGLTEKLDYLHDLGVTAIWLLPMYPSPFKDDGYDISDYHDIHKEYGAMKDFESFLEEAHRHDLRVITELVINHTSDQHPVVSRSPPEPLVALPGLLRLERYGQEIRGARDHLHRHGTVELVMGPGGQGSIIGIASSAISPT